MGPEATFLATISRSKFPLQKPRDTLRLMAEELWGDDAIRFRYLEQHFQTLLLLMTFAVVQ